MKKAPLLRMLCLALLLEALATHPVAAQAQPVSPDPACARDILKPVVATHTIPPYPALSLRMGEQGTTTIVVTIQADGTPSDAAVSKSSGSLRLDDAAVAHVKENWRWQPFDRNCAPSLQTLVNIVWDVRSAPSGPSPFVLVDLDAADYPPDARARQEEGVAAVGVLLSATGAIIDVRVVNSSNFADLDAKAVEIARTRWQWGPAQMAGKPVSSTVLLAMRWRLNPAQAPQAAAPAPGGK